MHRLGKAEIEKCLAGCPVHSRCSVNAHSSLYLHHFCPSTTLLFLLIRCPEVLLTHICPHAVSCEHGNKVDAPVCVHLVHAGVAKKSVTFSPNDGSSSAKLSLPPFEAILSNCIVTPVISACIRKKNLTKIGKFLCILTLKME